ncbi:MAG TPA: hypothetical protein VFH51_01810, partial [Myxococcota bacterium]|nr:hypothetical protein [Myxococcota bacterium]
MTRIHHPGNPTDASTPAETERHARAREAAGDAKLAFKAGVSERLAAAVRTASKPGADIAALLNARRGVNDAKYVFSFDALAKLSRHLAPGSPEHGAVADAL